MKKIIFFNLFIVPAFVFGISGEEIFKTKCALCHTYGEGKRIGPDLKGVTKKRSNQWMTSMIKDPGNWVKKDPEAQKLFEEYKKMPMMLVPPLKDDEVKAVIDYLNKKDSSK